MLVGLYTLIIILLHDIKVDEIPLRHYMCIASNLA